jgi:hypothetical protein
MLVALVDAALIGVGLVGPAGAVGAAVGGAGIPRWADPHRGRSCREGSRCSWRSPTGVRSLRSGYWRWSCALQQVEGHVLAPVVLGRATALHPLAVICLPHGARPPARRAGRLPRRAGRRERGPQHRLPALGRPTSDQPAGITSRPATSSRSFGGLCSRHNCQQRAVPPLPDSYEASFLCHDWNSTKAASSSTSSLRRLRDMPSPRR